MNKEQKTVPTSMQEVRNHKDNVYWLLNVPSGQIVIANDLRDLFNGKGGDKFYINNHDELIQYMLWWAEQGMAHGFTGNTCPGVHALKGDTYSICNYEPEDYDGWREEEIQGPYCNPYIPRPKEAKEVASICTDLWWFSIMDKAEYDKRGGKENDGVTIVDVKPGQYLFTSFCHNSEAFKADQFAEFQHIPEEVVDKLRPLIKGNNKKVVAKARLDRELWELERFDIRHHDMLQAHLTKVRHG